MLIPKIIHQIWWPWAKGSKMSSAAKFNQEQIRRFHPDYEYKFWGKEEIMNLPCFDWMSTMLFQYRDRPTCLCDIYRYRILQEFGGIYLDTDAFVLQSLSPLFEFFSECDFFVDIETVISAEFSLRMAKEQPIRKGKPEELVRLSSYFVASISHHFLLGEILARMAARSLETKNDYDILYNTGPAMLTEVLHENQSVSSMRWLDPSLSRNFIFHVGDGAWRSEPIIR